MVTAKIRVNPSKIKTYFRKNLGAPLIILFQVLVLLSGGLLIQGSSALADTIMTYSYYSLVIGVALQLIPFLMDGRRKQEENE